MWIGRKIKRESKKECYVVYFSMSIIVKTKAPMPWMAKKIHRFVSIDVRIIKKYFSNHLLNRW